MCVGALFCGTNDGAQSPVYAGLTLYHKASPLSLNVYERMSSE